MDAMTIVLFGATGDLAKRKLFPALYNLFLDQKLPNPYSIIGSGITDWSESEFQSFVKQSVQTYSRRERKDNSKLEEFVQAIRYCRVDATKPEEYKKLLYIVQQREAELHLPENRLFYLSVAPQFFEVITTNIKESGLGKTKGWKRLMIEKPFGHNLKSAQELNEKLRRAFHENEIYRVDHYLGKPMVQNLEALEFTNPVLRALWNNQYIANVQITASEIVGVEDRASYYDRAGAIRDMVQNHILQLLMMTAMHLTKEISTTNIRQEKYEVMKALRPLQEYEVGIHVVRGQYQSGEIDGKPVDGYTEEPGIESSSRNDTFVAARLWIDDEFWSGVPFYIRTGKRLKEKSTRIVIEFKNPFIQDEESQKTEPNLFVINVNPNEGVAFKLNSKNPLKNGKIEPVTVDFSNQEQNVPEAYEFLLADAICGDQTFFAHWDEVELSWKWVQPILNAFEKESVPLHPYAAGTEGPSAADQLLAMDGYKWW
ncbi:glucose-6-phosphate dehydrogenase [Halalkalibacterium ligniniphilum]|uniref:glucose-6-phosphate dehydrogenase n=1 Tax=Halalkalibacterium ligniniphilum TaxID=1134413 RepID=UPI0004777BE6|nr:glucose-6-phosphate dehydrogenase [Halalkalibacterium ligniniphilum]